MRLGIFVFVFFGFFFTACDSLQKDTGFTPSVHLYEEVNTSLSNLYTRIKPTQDTNTSALLLLDDAEEAFIARIGAIELADKTLDLQYFQWNDDEAGMIILSHLLAAAERGVRIRLLLDDSNTWNSLNDLPKLAPLSHHPNINIKIYNPLEGVLSSSGMRTMAIIGDFNRVNHRMHNKMLLADNILSIIGGRNIGNEYFGLHKDMNFRDMDILAIGKDIRAMSQAFDDYWNSEWTQRIEFIEDNEYTKEDFQRGRAYLQKRIDEIKDFPYVIPSSRQGFYERFAMRKSELDWAHVKVVADPPRKDRHPESDHLYYRLHDAGLIMPKYDYVASSPYLIPGEDMIAKLKSEIKKGVSYRVLTNSLASNDVTMAQYGYASRRRELLEAGVELYELNAKAKDVHKYIAEPFRKKSKLGLHAKLAVIDSQRVFVGSFNVDPRSRNINTEVVFMISSESLAKKIKVSLAHDFSYHNSYQVFLQKRMNEEGELEFGKMRWLGMEEGKEKIYKNEPNANFIKKLGELLFGLLPIDDQL